ncbi:hypothetical protein J7I44_06600 [Frateuria sp. MAH-13]|uniref:Secreted protein n=1 Tax=Frateuria flava TaxID=2821489 RepID=A0ABS4DLN3_9GAMM|nr:hypothetical protein [Frateuria flava]MBP1473961.1 hypothetical protein [Frateuria flava]
MTLRTTAWASVLLAGTMALAAWPAAPARAAETMVKCELSYNLQGWSIIYKHAEGAGTVTCDNGQSAPVKISVVGGGLTAGKFRVTDGKGEITRVHGIAEVFGDYVQAGAEAGVGKSAHAQVLTKGTTSLALTGTGQGIDLGVSVGKFTIARP